MHDAAADQLVELVARVDAAGPGIGLVVDAGLVELRRVDAVEPVGDVAELDGVAVADDGGSAALAADRADRTTQDRTSIDQMDEKQHFRNRMRVSQS